jgi:phosphoenolpyruvate carboxykinase (ATP)
MIVSGIVKGAWSMQTTYDEATREQQVVAHGLHPLGEVYRNLSVPLLIEHAIRRGEAELASNGALVAYTGTRTGRSPKDRFIVRNAATESLVNWGATNQPISQQAFDALRARIVDYLQERDVFVLDARAGADPQTSLPIRVITEYAWHNLFAKQLFIRLSTEELATHIPEWTVISAPGFKANPARDKVNSEVAVLLDFEAKEVLICGTEYAGEIKKSIFSVLNFMLPQQYILPMHCAANEGTNGDVALFFGLSGTGKTSLSSDPERKLIGDDEHGWDKNGVFNFEGGCYAKCIRLSPAHEPQIYHAIRYGSVIENVEIDPDTHDPLYDSERFTENTRVAYPLDFIENSVQIKRGGHATVLFFLTADAFGVLPPIARLTPKQAIYHFLSGYTAKLAGTEVGVTEPQTTFEACFGAPFLPLPPATYAILLGEKIKKHNTRVYLLNTGWTGGPFGIGKRFNIDHTRTMLRAAISGQLEQVATYTDPFFGLHVPVHIDGVPEEIMHPRETWRDKAEYDRLAHVLVSRFIENFDKKFGTLDPAMRQGGPRLP